MFRAFANIGGGRTLSDDQQRTTLPTGSSGASEDEARVQHVRVAILGTGFSGLGMAIRLKQRGQEDFVVIERAAEIGGTWRDNTYPGCACDIPSHLYSFSFALNPHWSRAYSPWYEIRDYLRSCAKRFGILPHIRWNSELLNASWNEDDQCWHIITTQGHITADILILGNGPLSEPSLPPIPGIERFEGVLFHSARWNHDYDLTGKRVAVIGTGASAIQFVPQIQPHVGHLSLFQRTPPWIVPRQDHPISTWQRAMFRILPITQRFVRARIFWRQELLALGFVYRPSMMEGGIRLARRHLEQQVPDPVLRAKLTPQYAMGCKRILLSDDFYPALAQSNVEVITDRIREVRANSIVTEDSREHEIICGTGFHVTDSQLPQYVHGRGGQSLADSWHSGPHAYFGATVPRFPNLFLLIGPNTGLGHNSMVFMIEAQVTYVLDCLRMMDRRKLRAVEVLPEIQETFNKPPRSPLAFQPRGGMGVPCLGQGWSGNVHTHCPLDISCEMLHTCSMKQALTAKLKLLTTAEQFQALRQTQLAYRDALNYVSQYSFAHGKKSNQQWLQRECYDDIRVRFGLPAQMACNVPRQVGATYRGLWTKARKNAEQRKAGGTKKRYKGLDQAPHYVSPTLTYNFHRDYSLKGGQQVGILTLGGRVIVPYTGYHKHVALIERGAKIGAAKLWYDKPKKRFYLLISLEVEVADPTPQTHQRVIGVDVGQRYLAVVGRLDNGTSFFAGKEVRAKADHYARLRKRLQKKGTRAATRRLVVVAARERRLKQDRNHVLSRRIVERHAHSLIGLEDLTHIRERAKRKHGKKASKKQRKANRHASKWAFAQLHGFLSYKARLSDSMAVKVDADYTSQACPKCGYTCEANRPKKGLLFECQNCHYTLHADLIGARNVALRTLLLRQDWMSTGVLSVRPGATSPDTSDREAKAARLLRYAELRWSPDASPAPSGLGSN